MRHSNWLLFLCWKLNGEAGETVLWIRDQTKGAMMRSKDIPDKQKSQALALGFGGEEGRKQVLGYFGRDAVPIVGNDQLRRRCSDGNQPLCVSYAFYSVFHDVDENLLEQNCVQSDWHCFVSEMEVDMDVCLRAQILKEGTTGLHLLTEVTELQLRLGNLDHFGEAGDEGGEGGESFCLLAGKAAYDSRHTVVHLMGNHTDDALVCRFFGKTHFRGQRFNEVERMLETTVRERQVADSEELRFTRDADGGCLAKGQGMDGCFDT